MCVCVCVCVCVCDSLFSSCFYRVYQTKVQLYYFIGRNGSLLIQAMHQPRPSALKYVVVAMLGVASLAAMSGVPGTVKEHLCHRWVTFYNL